MISIIFLHLWQRKSYGKVHQQLTNGTNTVLNALNRTKWLMCNQNPSKANSFQQNNFWLMQSREPRCPCMIKYANQKWSYKQNLLVFHDIFHMFNTVSNTPLWPNRYQNQSPTSVYRTKRLSNFAYLGNIKFRTMLSVWSLSILTTTTLQWTLDWHSNLIHHDYTKHSQAMRRIQWFLSWLRWTKWHTLMKKPTSPSNLPSNDVMKILGKMTLYPIYPVSDFTGNHCNQTTKGVAI